MVKIGLVGTGYWGKNHARVLHELASRGVIEEVVVCDADVGRAKAAAAGGRFVTNVRELLDDPSIAALDFCTPTPSHHPLARDAMLAGKDVFVEKPMTVTAKESRDLIDVATRESRVLQPGHIFRYHAGVNEVKKLIERGAFGRLLYLTSNRQAFREPRPDMGVMHALGIHEVDLFCYLLGQDYPESLWATTAQWHYPGIDETAHVHMTFPGDVHAHAFESWMSPTQGKDRHLVAVGERLSVFVDYLKPQEIVVHDSYLNAREGGTYEAVHEGSRTVPIQYKEPLEEELLDFVRCVQTRDTPRADMHAGLRAVEMVERALEVAKTRTPWRERA